MNDKMGIQEFGDRLIQTGDLDPLYIGLVGAVNNGMEHDQLARWLLAYWCFYHAGVASHISELDKSDYWDRMELAAANETSPRDFLDLPPGNSHPHRWPRAAERRHFRGDKCVRAVKWLEANSVGIPEAAVMSLMPYITDRGIMTEVQKWPLFGPWIAFKAADMMERVWGLTIAFDHNLGLMYEEPRAALDLLRKVNPTWTDPTPENIYNKLLTYFSPRRAPPIRSPRQRQCGPQEVETVLCKWKSYMGGHYHIGKDIREQREGLRGWGRTADLILRSYPAEVEDYAVSQMRSTAPLRSAEHPPDAA